MLEIIKCEEGVAYSDFKLLEQAQEIIDNYYNHGEWRVCTSTGNIILALRVLASRGIIPYDSMIIRFEDDIITLNDKFELSHYPQGYDDWEQEFLRELVFRRIGKIK